MKKILKIITISLFTIFSFYYTEKIINFAKEKDPIMINIEKESKNKQIKPVNAVITSTTILVGESGKKINEEASYEKMKKIKEYNEGLLEYINIKPSITKKENFDKAIIGKNTTKKEISIIFQTNDIDHINQIAYILNKNNVEATFYIDGKIIEKNFLEIKNKNIKLGLYSYNNISNNSSVKYMKNLLTKNFNYSNYCLYKDKEYIKACKYFNINTIKPEIIEKELYKKIKKNKKEGVIYRIKDTKENIKQLHTTLIYLKQKGYEVKSLEELLKE